MVKAHVPESKGFELEVEQGGEGLLGVCFKGVECGELECGQVGFL